MMSLPPVPLYLKNISNSNFCCTLFLQTLDTIFVQYSFLQYRVLFAWHGRGTHTKLEKYYLRDIENTKFARTQQTTNNNNTMCCCLPLGFQISTVRNTQHYSVNNIRDFLKSDQFYHNCCTHECDN